MTTIHVNKCIDDFEKAFKENLRSLKDCHTLLSDYAADDDQIAALLINLKSIGNSYKEEYVYFHKYQSAINATEEHWNQDDNINDSFETIFKAKLKEEKGVKSAADSIVDGILGFTKINADPDENGNDESLVCTPSIAHPIDPITKKPILIPFRNKVCSHVYEKDSILAYIRKKKKAKCPYVGCTNSVVKKDSMELDFTLSQRINQGEFTSTQFQQSITSIGESSDEELDTDDDDDDE